MSPIKVVSNRSPYLAFTIKKVSVETNPIGWPIFLFYSYLVLTFHVLALVFRVRVVGPGPVVEMALYLNLNINL